MRVNTPGGEWLTGDFERYYREGFQELRDRIGDDWAQEYVFLDMLNIASHLLVYLEEEAGRPAQHWLERVRDDYVEPTDEEES